ncbi:MAG: TIGR00730 family Rossman fold protein [Patescibacteria group bacterium]
MINSPISFRPKHLTIDDIREGCITLYGENNEETKICMMQEEMRQGIDVITDFTPSVTFYGSARLPEDHPAYIQARSLAYRISKELGYTVLSGGGPGVMEAANRGAFEAGGKSVGLTIKLPHEQFTNKYVTEELPFYFFFSRQVSMSYATEVCIFCPGGFGTFDELFEMLTLQQTGKIGRIPVILLGVEFWMPFQRLIEEILVEKYKTVSPSDLHLYTITDDEDEILRIISESRLRDGKDALS